MSLEYTCSTNRNNICQALSFSSLLWCSYKSPNHPRTAHNSGKLDLTLHSLAYCSRESMTNNKTDLTHLGRCEVSDERYVPNLSHTRLYSTAVHHVISTTSRFEVTTNLFFIRQLSSSRLAAPATATVRWSTPALQAYYLLRPNILLRPRNPRLQWYFKQYRRKSASGRFRRLHRIPTTFRSCK